MDRRYSKVNLIDDRPEVTGVVAPTWTHVVFDAPYNQLAPSPYRLRAWSAWPELLAKMASVV